MSGEYRDPIDSVAGDSFDTEVGKVDIQGHLYPLVLGDQSHKTSKKFGYARVDDQFIAFNGHHKLLKVEIAEENYIKTYPRPSEIRSGCAVKISIDSCEIWQKKFSDRHRAMQGAEQYIDGIQPHLHWFPFGVGDYLGRRIGYMDIESEIASVLISCSRILIKSVPGIPYPRLLSEDPIEYVKSIHKEIDILDPSICWSIPS